MDAKEFDAAYDVARSGDFFSISISDDADIKDKLGQEAGVLIQFGTGAVSHIGFLREKISDMAVEAIDTGTVPCQITRYRGVKGVDITFWRLKGLTTEGLTAMFTLCDKIVGEKHPYDWGLIFRMTGRSILGKIPLIGFFISNLFRKLPFFGNNSKAYICSEVSTIIARAADKEFRKDYNPDMVTPTMFCQSSRLTQVSRAVCEE